MRIKTGRATEPEPAPAPAPRNLLAATAESGQLRIVDEALARFTHRELVAGAEVVDFLLDLRSAMVTDAGPAEIIVSNGAAG